MYIVCPQCNFSKNVPDERIPLNAQSVTCPRCKAKFSLSGRPQKLTREPVIEPIVEKPKPPIIPTILTPTPSAPVPEESSLQQEETDIPWESTSRNMFISMINTIVGVTFSPSKFYATMSPTGKASFPLAFAMITGGAGWLLNVFWEYLFVSGLLHQLNQPWVAWIGTGTLIFCALFLPLLVTVVLYFSSAMTHLGLIILGGNNKPFKATFKVLAYAYAPQVFCVIPGLGGLIGLVWMIVVATIGLSTVHQISKVKALLSLFLIQIILLAVSIITSILLPLLFNGTTAV
jgi:predicted Zn finger-like uncharacterized protein